MSATIWDRRITPAPTQETAGCHCPEARAFGHQPNCPVTPQPMPACAPSCTNDVCWTRCRIWGIQARVFGWPVPEAEEAPEEAVA